MTTGSTIAQIGRNELVGVVRVAIPLGHRRNELIFIEARVLLTGGTGDRHRSHSVQDTILAEQPLDSPSELRIVLAEHLAGIGGGNGQGSRDNLVGQLELTLIVALAVPLRRRT